MAALSVVAVFVLLVTILVPRAAQADQFDSQINALKAQVAANQKAANQKAAEANTLKNKIATIDAQINVAQTALNLTNTQIGQTNAQIDAANKDLERQKSVLRENLRQLYKTGEISPIEVVASSKNLSDFVAQQQYFSAIKKKIDQNLEKIDVLKKDLDVKKNQLSELGSQQKAQVDGINSQRAQQAQLLAQTQGDEAKYQQIAASQSAQVSSLQAAQAASWARIQAGSNGNSGTVGSFQYKNWTGNQGSCAGGYPSPLCSAGQDTMIDQWQLYNRECVSYAAWAMVYRFGKTVHGFRGAGMAYQWPNTTAGYAPHDSNPTPGSVMVIPQSMIGGVGHVAVVESVSGGWARVSQFNWGLNGQYSQMDVKIVPGLVFIHF